MALILDTLLFSQRLQKAGFSQEQAEAHAELTRDMVLAEVASRDDLKRELAHLQSEMAAFEEKLINRVTRIFTALVVGTIALIGAGVTLYMNIGRVFGK
jgi:hypothetical protein